MKLAPKIVHFIAHNLLNINAYNFPHYFVHNKLVV